MILIELLTEASEEAGNQRSYATESLLQDLMESHGKFVWMLRSFSETSTKKVQEEVETTEETEVETTEETTEE
jgi:hypothetical protein